MVFEYGNRLREQAAAPGSRARCDPRLRGRVRASDPLARHRAVPLDRADRRSGGPASERGRPVEVIGTGRWIVDQLARTRVPLRAAGADLLARARRARCGRGAAQRARPRRRDRPLALGRDHMDLPRSRRRRGRPRGCSTAATRSPTGPSSRRCSTPRRARVGRDRHGGGVGIGQSIHSGIVVVADGSEFAERKLRRVFWADPALGVARYADAGYADAIEQAQPAASRRPDRCSRSPGIAARRRSRSARNPWIRSSS